MPFEAELVIRTESTSETRTDFFVDGALFSIEGDYERNDSEDSHPLEHTGFTTEQANKLRGIEGPEPKNKREFSESQALAIVSGGIAVLLPPLVLIDSAVLGIPPTPGKVVAGIIFVVCGVGSLFAVRAGRAETRERMANFDKRHAKWTKRIGIINNHTVVEPVPEPAQP